MTPLFDVGTIQLSRRALGVLGGAGIHPLELIKRHEFGDWGALGSLEWRFNDRAVIMGGEVVASQYRVGLSLDVWIVTNLLTDRTRMLLGDEW